MSTQRPTTAPSTPNTTTEVLKTAAKLTAAALLVLSIAGCTSDAFQNAMGWENGEPTPDKVDAGNTDGSSIDGKEADSK